MKMFKVVKMLAAGVAGAVFIYVFFVTTLISEPLFNLYAGLLDNWVASGAKTSSVQSDVVENCGKQPVATQAGFFGYIAMSTFNREELDFRVDVCSKMTVNRV